jgi:D-glycero-D-manno-heptose 1,7-bisphosphate phosphatase
MTLPKLIIFDRDNTLIMNKDGYLYQPEDLEWYTGAKEVLKMLQDSNIRVAIATNQSGVARGLFSSKQVEHFHNFMNNPQQANGTIDLFVFCPHHPQGSVPEFSTSCNCRKPLPGLVLDILSKFNVDPKECVLFGDSLSDIQAGLSAGVPSFLVLPGEIQSAVIEKVWGK